MNRVYRIKSDGTVAAIIGSFGHGNGEFCVPEAWQSTVKAGCTWWTRATTGAGISKDDRYLNSWGSYGDGEGEFDDPSASPSAPPGSCSSPIPATTGSRKFDLSGAFKSQGGGSGTEAGQFLNPLG